MKSFLLRFKGTIVASAQVQKMTAKMSEKSCGLYVYGPFDKIRVEEPPLRLVFMDERKHGHLVANRLGKALFLPYILQNFWDFDF